MKQLVELQKHADEFKRLNTELVFVFREESKGVDGLKIIRDKHQTDYTLTLDEKKSSRMYSEGKNEFDNYIIDSEGKIRGIIDGTKTDRATAVELIKVLKQIESGKDAP